MKKTVQLMLCLLGVIIVFSSFKMIVKAGAKKSVVRVFVSKRIYPNVSGKASLRPSDFYAVTDTVVSLGSNDYYVKFGFYFVTGGGTTYTQANATQALTIDGQADAGAETFTGTIARFHSSGISNSFTTTNPSSITTTSCTPDHIGTTPIYLDE